jgi:TrwC relaxase
LPFRGVTMSLHKLTAGSGYDYLTRQVAALDATDKGRTGLASYYTERGESPGVWVGSGMDGIDGLDVGDPVTAEQMRALFGCGLHPLAELRLQQWEGLDFIGQDLQDVMRLGAPFKIMDDATPFRVEVAKRIIALNAAIGEPVDASVGAADRARIRTQVAREFFVAEHGRAPIDAGELAGQVAKSSRPRGADSGRFRLDVFAGEVGVDAVGGRRTGGGGGDRTGPSGRGQRRAELHRAACFVHPDRASRGPAGQRSGLGRSGVHPPRQPCR